jgi:hypothetical protein
MHFVFEILDKLDAAYLLLLSRITGGLVAYGLLGELLLNCEP